MNTIKAKDAKKINERLRNIYNNQRRRAAEHSSTLDYKLDDLKRLCYAYINEPCYYCDKPLTPKTFSFDHIDPIGRPAGHFGISNLRLVCLTCNQRKGMLSEWEYTSLLSLLDGFGPEPKMDVLSRLRAGGRVKFR